MVRYYLLTEADRLAPTLRFLLATLRGARAKLARLDRQGDADFRRVAALERLEHRILAGADRLGVVLTEGIRCEAWIPFEHQWVGPAGDYRVRPAYFVYTDALDRIERWFFAGWPEDRRPVPPEWRRVERVANA